METLKLQVPIKIKDEVAENVYEVKLNFIGNKKIFGETITLKFKVQKWIQKSQKNSSRN